MPPRNTGCEATSKVPSPAPKPQLQVHTLTGERWALQRCKRTLPYRLLVFASLMHWPVFFGLLVIEHLLVASDGTPQHKAKKPTFVGRSQKSSSCLHSKPPLIGAVTVGSPLIWRGGTPQMLKGTHEKILRSVLSEPGASFWPSGARPTQSRSFCEPRLFQQCSPSCADIRSSCLNAVVFLQLGLHQLEILHHLSKFCLHPLASRRSEGFCPRTSPLRHTTCGPWLFPRPRGLPETAVSSSGSTVTKV